MAVGTASSCCFSTSSIKTFQFLSPKTFLSFSNPTFSSITSLSSPIPRLASNNFSLFRRLNRIFCNSVSTISTNTTHYKGASCAEVITDFLARVENS